MHSPSPQLHGDPAQPDVNSEESSPESLRRRVLAGAVLWPSFVAAGVLEALTFLMVDPMDVHWLGHELALSRTAIYSLVFLMYWSACAASAAGAIWVARRLQS